MNTPFKPQNTKLAATKRIMRDLRDHEKVPVPGLGVTCPDESNPFLLHCNVLINDGPYRGVIIHLILHIPEDYPLTGPAGNIAPGLDFNSTYHGHIHDDRTHGHALCNDLLTNYASYFRHIDSGTAQQASGWSPGYTLSTALLQIVTFFAEPDLRNTPSLENIDRLHTMVKQFKCSICGHTYEQPNPRIVDYTVNNASEIDKSETEDLILKRQLKEKLTCGVTKQNVLEDKICLGYPLLIKRDRYGRLWSDIILELISYDAYVAQIQKSGGNKLDYYENLRFRSVTGKDYNHWLPIYINKEHFEQCQIFIQNSISIIHTGTALGSAQYDFRPTMALSVLTTLMNKSSVQLFNGQMYESKHAIEAFCHFLRLLMHFIDIYPELDQEINNTIEKFIEDLGNRNKKYIPDIGEFLIKIALSKNYRFDTIKEYIYEEYFARQIYWIQRNNAIPNLLNMQIQHLPLIFQSVKVSNHLLVFNLEMAATFIHSDVKQHLDRSYGYPPDTIVENFQERLKAIKAMNVYSDFVKAIKMDTVIKSPNDMIDLLIRSIRVSNQQGYTNIFSDQEQQDQKFDARTRGIKQQQQPYNNGKR
ncbi:unnamed protein product [Rotaria socialis]|uniref:UBC core domain-containing protein n=1 Tax=Rotaria socialis TaxID=392032 RepID=A0A817ZX21_9BILA|nr:unnamed protein product [Rotaria socialis]CAF4202472.1 unnamed protein product [Rotaria socialis]